MSANGKSYDCIIIGGGLAGLSLSILLSRKHFKVLVVEKESYPHHKVCGEYISMESWNFLCFLGLPLTEMKLPQISKLIVTAPNGSALNVKLPLGGFGISRYLLDNSLKNIAEKEGVIILDRTKVTEINFANDIFSVCTTAGNFSARICAGSWGKRSSLDVKWNRHFIEKSKTSLDNFIGVKYHIKTNLPADTITLHNFEDGYCGVSKVEGDTYCLCYLTTAKNLKSCQNDILKMETEILSKNPQLKNLLETSQKIWDKPVTISQISFSDKTQVENHVLLLGDAAGMITPLCGNGMSMALHSAKVAAEPIIAFLQQLISRQQAEDAHAAEWKKIFEKRLRTGRRIQSLFGKSSITNLFIGMMKFVPGLTRQIIKKTHGKPF